jgi:hypothetical protein
LVSQDCNGAIGEFSNSGPLARERKDSSFLPWPVSCLPRRYLNFAPEMRSIDANFLFNTGQLSRFPKFATFPTEIALFFALLKEAQIHCVNWPSFQKSCLNFSLIHFEIWIVCSQFTSFSQTEFFCSRSVLSHCATLGVGLSEFLSSHSRSVADRYLPRSFISPFICPENEVGAHFLHR